MIGTNNTATAFLSLLDETEPELHFYALQQLNDAVDEHWAEIAHSIEKIEILYEDEDFQYRNLAALVASKVYYHLGEFHDAMTYALGAGDLFDIRSKSEYVDTLVSFCFDEYITRRVSSENGEKSEIDPRLENIIQSMFDRCFENEDYKEALGIALEARLMDKIKEAIERSNDKEGMLEYCKDVCLSLVTQREFRHSVFLLLVEIYSNLDKPDYLTVCRILVFLDDAKQTSVILEKLLRSGPDEHLLAYQIAFDLVSNGTQQFLQRVRESLPVVEKLDDGDDDATEGPTAMEIDEKKEESDDFNSRNAKTHNILSGQVSIKLYLEFLHRNNHADLTILKNTKHALDARQSITHSALVFANAIMNAGTTRDSFLRENLEWLGRATNWAKFTATAGLGVIHKGHLAKGFRLLDPYLPKPDNRGSGPYSEGGALYALGLIHANHGEEILQYLRDSLSLGNSDPSQKYIIQHGACLGLGVAGMATGNLEIYNDLKNVLMENDASAGEAAGLAMGLVMLGTASETAILEMREHARNTQHEKIIRGLAIGIAMVMYGREEQADICIDDLISNTDPIMRYGAMFTIAMAYCGTANNNAIRKLLHIAVSDVSDDVRRAAVMCLGFLLSSQPEQCPKMVSLLSESYNPHVRYGATMAVGIACAGTAMPEAIDLLLPMTSDSEAFVRQGALIALAMVLIQTTKAQEPRVEKVRKLFEEKITTKGEHVMTKFGATLAQGIIDAGGRNCSISVHSLSGHQNLPATVGLAVFTQYWYWYPLTHFLSLALIPTTMICLNKDLKLPKFSFSSYCKPSLFAYPAKIKPPTTTAPTKVATAILSTTRKAKALAQKKEDKKKADSSSMDIDTSEEVKKEEPEEKKEVKKKKEPNMEIKHNPCRVPLAQLKYLACDVDKRYQPVRFTNKGDLFGIVVLKDLRPGESEELEFEEGSEEQKDKSKQENKESDKDAEGEAEPPAVFTFSETG